MTNNFTQTLLSMEIDDIPNPTALPTGTEYSGVVKGHEWRKLKQKDGTDATILTLVVKFLDWSPEIPEHERLDSKGELVDITSKQARMDYFVESESGAAALRDLLKSCGLKGKVESAIPMLTGQMVVASGTQKLLEKDNSIVFNLKKLVAVA